MTESPPSGVLADELRAWLEFTTKTGVRLPYRPFRLVVEDVLAALASPPPQATGALSEPLVRSCETCLHASLKESLDPCRTCKPEMSTAVWTNWQPAAPQVEPEDKQP